jgi:PPOX class probable F420-dependent enzyme
MSQPAAVSEEVRRFLDREPVGVVATLRPDGTARQSVTYYVRDGGRIFISTESKRAKARDVERSGWASLCVVGHAPPFPSVTVEGPARILRGGIADATARIFAKMTGGNPPEMTDKTLADMDRVILEITMDRVYGASYLNQ